MADSDMITRLTVEQAVRDFSDTPFFGVSFFEDNRPPLNFWQRIPLRLRDAKYYLNGFFSGRLALTVRGRLVEIQEG